MNAFEKKEYVTALGHRKFFKPLLTALTSEDYDLLAQRYSRMYSWHCVIPDYDCSIEWADALRKYETPDGEFGLVAAIYSDSGLNLKKRRIMLEADMDRGKFKKTNTCAITIFNCHTPCAVGEHYIFDLNRNFYGF